MPPKPFFPPKHVPLKKRPIPHVKHLIAVSSGKGGVGKSTLATNLAFALALRKERPSVGLLDLDVFGPSLPTLLGLLGGKGKGKGKGTEESEEEDFLKAQVTPSGALKPLTAHGLPIMSMGFLVPPGAPIVWRGLMVQKAIQQLLFDVDWSSSNGGLDILVMDLPPGTGDVPLSLAQLVSLDGSIIVSTPQDLSLADVRKGINMFKKLEVPILGMVLNQAYYQCPTCVEPKKQYIFGAFPSFSSLLFSFLREEIIGEPKAFQTLAQDSQIPILAHLPLIQDVSSSSDSGTPYMLTKPSSHTSQSWQAGLHDVASKIYSSLYP